MLDSGIKRTHHHQIASSKAMTSNNAQNIQVAVRCRPLNERELKLNSHSIIECNERSREVNAFDKTGTISLDKKFTYDKVFGVTSKQGEVYNQLVKPVVLEVIEGYNCTIFAYGQTGTGKTHTMEGYWSTMNDLAQAWDSDQMVGIIPRSVAHLFTCLNSISNCDYSVKISFIELYNEELSDLLAEGNENDKLRIFDDPERKGSVKIPGLEEIVVKNKAEVYKILQKGSNRRQQAATLMNSKSSRSHSIFTITVFIKEKSIEGEETIKVGKLNLVDLAGSENIERSGATGKRAAEAGKINKSLTTLGRVITALVEHRDHIPYRESNLTRLLQDSLGGRTKTTLIATISPAMCNLEETLSTLDYAHKAKSIRNKPEVNQKLVKKALIKEYNEEIEKLKRELYSTREKNGIYLPQDVYDDLEAKLANQKEELREHLTKITSLSEDFEKLDELYADTKKSLAERNVQLKKTTETLQQTEIHLEKVKVKCDETKYLLDEQVSTEKRLYSDAAMLKSLTIEQHEDCEKLHEKIERVTTVTDNNKDLTEQFAKHISQRMMELQSGDLGLSVQHTSSLCSVCDALRECFERLDDMKTENVCQLNIYEQKQQKWLELRQKFLEDNFKNGFQSYYEQFLAQFDQSKQKITCETDNQLKLCIQHHSLFTQTYEELTAHINTQLEHNQQFKNSFEQGSEVYIAKTEADMKTNTDELVKDIKYLVRSTSDTRQDLSELKELKDTFKNDFKSTINQLMDKFETCFEKLDVKIVRLTEKNEKDNAELNKLKKKARDVLETRITDGKKDFEELVVVPVIGLLEANNQNLIELNTLSKSLADNYQESVAHFQDSLETAGLTQKETLSSLDKFTFEQNEAVIKNCADLTNEIAQYRKESEQFFVNFTAHSVEHELCDVLETIGEARAEIKNTNSSIGVRSEDTQQFCSQVMRSVDIFANGEFETVVVTGQTPKLKSFEPVGELARTRDHSELIESYRSKLNELDIMAPPKTSPEKEVETNLHKAASEGSLNHVETKIETSHPLKRVATDKENFGDNKASKHAKAFTGRTMSKAKRPAFGTAN